MWQRHLQTVNATKICLFYETGFLCFVCIVFSLLRRIPNHTHVHSIHYQSKNHTVSMKQSPQDSNDGDTTQYCEIHSKDKSKNIENL